jgi:hypothetical protein
MTKKLLLTYAVILFSILNSYSQFDDFDDVFVFNGTKPVIDNKITAHDSNCGIQSLTLKWSSVFYEYDHVSSYSLQVLNGGNWTTIQTIPQGSFPYSVTLTSFQNGWNDSEGNFNFRVQVNVNLEDVTTYTYLQGETLKVKDWCFGAAVNVNLTQATINSSGYTSNLGSSTPTIYISNIGQTYTEYFTIETTTRTSGTNFGSGNVDIKTYLSTCSTLGASCSGSGIGTEEYSIDLISIPYRVASGTETYRRSDFRLKVNDGNVVLVNNQTYYLHVRYSINGGTTKGFVWPIRIEYRDNSSGGCIFCPPSPYQGIQTLSNPTTDLSPYSVDIYDMSGNKIITKTFSTKEQEDDYLNSLPKKIYVVKSKFGTRKVY